MNIGRFCKRIDACFGTKGLKHGHGKDGDEATQVFSRKGRAEK